MTLLQKIIEKSQESASECLSFVIPFEPPTERKKLKKYQSKIEKINELLQKTKGNDDLKTDLAIKQMEKDFKVKIFPINDDSAKKEEEKERMKLKSLIEQDLAGEISNYFKEFLNYKKLKIELRKLQETDLIYLFGLIFDALSKFDGSSTSKPQVLNVSDDPVQVQTGKKSNKHQCSLEDVMDMFLIIFDCNLLTIKNNTNILTMVTEIGNFFKKELEFELTLRKRLCGPLALFEKLAKGSMHKPVYREYTVTVLNF
jgi:hypothetical protein